MNLVAALEGTRALSFLRFFRFASIRTKMLMFAVVATLLPSLTTVWISYIENKRALQAKASEELLGVSAQALREVDLWTKELRYDLRVFSSSYEVTENLERIPLVNGEPIHSGIYYKRLTDYLNSVRDRFPDYAELLVLDRHSHVVATTAPQVRPVPLPADWSSAVKTKDWARGEPYWDATSERDQIMVSVSIETTRRSGAERLLGGLAARVNLRGVGETLHRFAPGETGQIYLMSRDGRLIISWRGSSAALMDQRYAARDTKWMLAHEGRAMQFSSFTGDRAVGSIRLEPALDWFVVSEIPSVEAFRQVARLRNVTLGIVSLLLAVVGALAYFLSLLVVRPLDRLSEAAGRVAKGDLDVGLPVTTGGEVGYLTEVFNNMVTKLRESRTELERLSVTDPLTGLYNPVRMLEVLVNEVRRSRRPRPPFAVLMGGLHLFQKEHHAHGHQAGDGVLKRLGALMREASRDVDFVARYGGEEFLLMMPETEIDAAKKLAERIRRKIADEKLAAGKITLSLGVAAFPLHGDGPEPLIAAADAALYAAKRAGGNRVVAATGGGPVVPAA